MNNEIKYPLYLKFWFSWFVLTTIYVPISFYEFYVARAVNMFFELVTRVISPFVPFGYMDSFVLFGGPKDAKLLAAVALTLVIVSLIFIDRLAVILKIRNRFLKIVYNLFCLFILTGVTDYIIWGAFSSIYFLLFGDFKFTRDYF